jgi:Ca-activated chloride channel family protein
MKYSLIIISIVVSFLSFSQDEVKKNIYKGNIFYHDSEFEDAAYYYEKVLTESGFNFKANYNLANTQVRLEQFDKAIETYKKIAEYTNTNTKKAKIYHNIGNAQMYLLEQESKDKQVKASDLLEKLEDAIESYKTALRVNPRDEETRYNLAYALLIKKQLEEQKKEEQKSDDKKESDDEKESEDKKDGDKSDSDDKKDGDKKEGDPSDDKEKDGEPKDEDGDKPEEEKESDKKDDKDSKGDPKEQAPQQQISNAQAKRILEAAEKAEKEIQNKLNKQKVIVGEKGKTGTKKDW